MQVELPKTISALKAATLLRNALQTQCEPVCLPDGPTHLITLSTPANCPDDPMTVAGMIVAASNGTAVGNATEDRRGPLQKKLITALTSALGSGKILLAEASTGIGKSRAIATATVHTITNDPAAVVWIAVPTIQTLAHMLAEFGQVDPNARPTPLFGRQQFLSVGALKELAPDVATTLESWLESGAKPVSEHTKLIANSLSCRCSHFLDDAKLLAPELPLTECQLQYGDDEEPGDAVANSIRTIASMSRIVITTHAMVSILVRTTKPDMPLPFTHLLIDEAHSFETAAANSLGASVSLAGARYALTKANLPANTIKPITELFNALQSGPLEDGFLDERDTETRALIAAKFAWLKRSLKKHNANAIVTDINTSAGRIVEAMASNRAIHVSFSPVRRYPSLVVGPRGLGSFFSRLWECQAACLLSGTLAVQGNYSYVARKCRIPLERYSTVDPIIAPWIREKLLYRIPRPDKATQLSYPGDSEHEAYPSWIKAVSNAIENITAKATGGTLILTNSFVDRTSIYESLADSIADRLIDPSMSIPLGKAAYQAAYAAGQRPVWIATGAAWTGLDLRADGEPSQDNMVSDLVVVRVPFGLAKHSTHLFRKHSGSSNNAFMLDRAECLIHLRQGIGRLIRQDRTPQKQVWLLDGRAFKVDPQSGTRSVIRPLISGFQSQPF